MPKVAIGLPVFNGAEFLARALDSHIDQTFADFELVITDNCSTDETEEIARKYAEKDPRIRYVRNDENIGASPNFQKAYAETTAPYFRWAAHDDWIAPTYLEECVRFLDEDQDAAIVFTGMVITRSDESVRRTTTQNIKGADSPSAFRRFHRIIWALKDSTSPVFGLARREALEKTGLVRNSPEPDRILIAELSLQGGIHQIEDLLFYRTLADGQYSRDNWAWLNPKNLGTSKRGWARVTQHHLNAITASELSGLKKQILKLDLIAAFVIRRPYYRLRRIWVQNIRKTKQRRTAAAA